VSLPDWASERIAQEVEAYLRRPDSGGDGGLAEAVYRLRAWPVYGDIGGTLLLGADGEVYSQVHDTMAVGPESDPGWRTLAWAAAVEKVPELRALLPARPAGIPDCLACEGFGRVQVTQQVYVWCGGCNGQGWQWPVASSS